MGILEPGHICGTLIKSKLCSGSPHWVYHGFVKAAQSEAHAPSPASSYLFPFWDVWSACGLKTFFAQSFFLPFCCSQANIREVSCSAGTSICVSLSGHNSFLWGCPRSQALNCCLSTLSPQMSSLSFWMFSAISALKTLRFVTPALSSLLNSRYLHPIRSSRLCWLSNRSPRLNVSKSKPLTFSPKSVPSSIFPVLLNSNSIFIAAEGKHFDVALDFSHSLRAHIQSISKSCGFHPKIHAEPDRFSPPAQGQHCFEPSCPLLWITAIPSVSTSYFYPWPI